MKENQAVQALPFWDLFFDFYFQAKVEFDRIGTTGKFFLFVCVFVHFTNYLFILQVFSASICEGLSKHFLSMRQYLRNKPNGQSVGLAYELFATWDRASILYPSFFTRGFFKKNIYNLSK